jgi:hypothetical protein
MKSPPLDVQKGLCPQYFSLAAIFRPVVRAWTFFLKNRKDDPDNIRDVLP